VFGAPKLQELIDAAERICHEDFGKTLAICFRRRKRRKYR